MELYSVLAERINKLGEPFRFSDKILGPAPGYVSDYLERELNDHTSSVIKHIASPLYSCFFICGILSPAKVVAL